MSCLVFSGCFDQTQNMIFPKDEPASKMNNEKLGEVLAATVLELEGGEGRWTMNIDGVNVICLTDETNNRMRFISPIKGLAELDPDALYLCMAANFHSALDARYCIHENVLWSAFIHPLSDLSEESIQNGLAQTVQLVKTYGTTYSSGPLQFGGP
ncbi:MAG: hypothetical protein AAFY98_02265 [Verrucomicrobiota bacterium]